MSKVVLKCQNLNKKLSKTAKISNVSFSLNERDILGFIGPNGAGKTTIIKSILGLYKIDSGKIEINGYDLEKDFVKAISNVGAIIENPDLYSYMTGYENLMIAAKIYDIKKERVNQIIKLVGLENKINLKVSKYSLGMKQRLGIAQSILHNPKILILDEPTNGLDPSGIIELNNLLLELSKGGMSIIISSHILSELETICNKFCIVNEGKIIYKKTIDKLKKGQQISGYIFEISDIEKIKNKLKYEKVDSKHIKIKTAKNNINNIIKKLLENNIQIYEIKAENLSLESIFLNTIRGESNE